MEIITRPAKTGVHNGQLEAALDLARKGYYIVPLCWPTFDNEEPCAVHKDGKGCKTPGKAPLVKWKAEPTCDEATIRQWWAKWPKANLAIALEPSGLIDIAPDSMEWLEEFERRRLPQTARYLSGGGKGHEHFLYRRPADCPVTKINKPAEYDITVNGLAVAPPSCHPSGVKYVWVHEPPAVADLPEAPAWAVKMLRDVVAKHSTAAPVPVATAAATMTEPPMRLSADGLAWWDGTHTVEKEAGVVDKSATLFKLGQVLARAGAGRTLIATALADRDQALGLNKYAGRPDAAQRYSDIADKVLNDVTSKGTKFTPAPAAPKGPIVLKTAASLVAKTIDPPQWLVPGFIAEGLTVLGGKPKIGKSLMLLGLSIAVASGGRMFGTVPVDKAEVLYLALDDNEVILQSRLKSMLKGEATPDGFYYATDWPALDKGGLEQLEQTLEAYPGIKLILVDTWKRVKPQGKWNANAYDADYEAFMPLQRLASKHRIAVVVSHHLRKALADDEMDELSGSTGLSAAVDATMIIKKRNRNEAEASIFVDGRLYSGSKTHALKFDPHTLQWILLGDFEEVKLSKERREILDVLEKEGPMTPKQLADRLDKARTTVQTLLNKLAEENRVHNIGKGQYKSIVSVVSIDSVASIDSVVSDSSSNGAVKATRGETIALEGHSLAISDSNHINEVETIETTQFIESWEEI